MSRYVPPSKRKEEKATFDPKTLSNDTCFPGLSAPVTPKVVKGGFKEVIEERLRKEAEDAIRAAQPLDLWSMSVEERESQGYTTIKIGGNTKEELSAMLQRLYRPIQPQEEYW